MRVFIDSSALVKKYIKEKGTEQIIEELSKAEKVYVSLISLPETFSALNRLKRDRLITSHHYVQLKQNVLNDFKNFYICQVTAEVIASPLKLLERHPIKTMDAIHLASALEIKADLFISADLKQLKAASKSKIKVLQA